MNLLFLLLAISLSHAASIREPVIVIHSDKKVDIGIYPDDSVKLRVLQDETPRFRKFDSLESYNQSVPKGIRITKSTLDWLRQKSKNTITFGGFVYELGEMEHHKYGVSPRLVQLAALQNEGFVNQQKEQLTPEHFSLVSATLNDDLSVTAELFFNPSLWKQNTRILVTFGSLESFARIVENGRFGKELYAKDKRYNIQASDFERAQIHFSLTFQNEQIFAQKTVYWQKSYGHERDWTIRTPNSPDLRICQEGLEGLTDEQKYERTKQQLLRLLPKRG